MLVGCEFQKEALKWEFAVLPQNPDRQTVPESPWCACVHQEITSLTLLTLEIKLFCLLILVNNWNHRHARIKEILCMEPLQDRCGPINASMILRKSSMRLVLKRVINILFSQGGRGTFQKSWWSMVLYLKSSSSSSLLSSPSYHRHIIMAYFAIKKVFINHSIYLTNRLRRPPEKQPPLTISHWNMRFYLPTIQ